MKKTLATLVIGLFTSLVMGAANPALVPVSVSAQAAPLIAVSQNGYHPKGIKRFVEYGTDSSFTINDSLGNPVYSGNLVQPSDSNNNPVDCQGGQVCRVGDFSDLMLEGTYSVDVNGRSSVPFKVDQDVYMNDANLLMEFFNAQLQQGSAYHLDLHKAQNPPFPMMADGSPIMEADMATKTLIRLGSAFRTAPEIFSDKYMTGVPDITEQIRKYVDYVEELQGHLKPYDISRGWNNNFGCGTTSPDEEKWNTTPDTCMTFFTSTTPLYTTSGLLSLLEALPALDTAKQQEVLGRAIATYGYAKTLALGADEQGYLGASSFLLYDYTGDAQFLTDAYSLRSVIPEAMDAIGTTGNEFYWEEYSRHKQAISGSGLEFMLNGTNPDGYFLLKIRGDFPRMANGEGVYDINGAIKFQNSRFMLSEALFAAKARSITGWKEGADVASLQLAFLTGMNSLQDGSGAGSHVSRSLIYGIGQNPNHFHSRLVPSNFFEAGGVFLNGSKIIPGWIAGVYDSNGDGAFNLDDSSWGQWTFVETTNEMVAQAIELVAYLHRIDSNAPAKPDYLFAKDIPASCVGGNIVSDVYNGGRAIECAGGGNDLKVTIWDKPDASVPPQFFEMYRQSGTGTGLSICLLTTCIADNGYAKSPDFPIPAPVPNMPLKNYLAMIRK